MNLSIVIFSAIVLSTFVIGNYIGLGQVKGTKQEMVRSFVELPPTYTPIPTPTSQPQTETTPKPTETPAPRPKADQPLAETVVRVPTKLPTPKATLTTSVRIKPTNTPTPQPKVDQRLPTQARLTETVTPTFIPTQTQTPTSTPVLPTPTRVIASAGQIDSYFEKYSREYSVDISLLRKIAVCESGYNTNSKSKYGYAGMFQFSEVAWRGVRTRMGLDPTPDLRFNPEESIKTAAYKISKDGTGAWPACSK